MCVFDFLFVSLFCFGFFCGVVLKENCYEQKMKDKKESVSTLLFPDGRSL